MPGIYKGGSPVTPSFPGLTAVYVGATKVWPAATGYYSTRWLRWNNSAELEKSNADITTLTTAAGWRNFDWGATFNLWGGGIGCLSLTGVQSVWNRVIHSAPATNGTEGGVTSFVSSNGTPGLNGSLLSRAFFPPGEAPDVAVEEVYAYVSGNGTVGWSSIPGITCNRITTGTYNMTFPRNLANPWVIANPQKNTGEGPSSAYRAMVQSIAGNTCQVKIAVPASLTNSSGFALWAALVPA